MLLESSASWPPILGGPGATGCRFPIGGEGVLNGVYPTNDNQVTFSCTFEGHEFRCHLIADSAKDAEKIIELLSRNFGKTVKELGELQVDIVRA